jgi:pimeloyl-ACP methyl ester carboxylesterase
MNRRTDATCALCGTWLAMVLVAGWAWADEGVAQSPAQKKSSAGGGMSLLNPKAVLDSAISWSDVWFFHQWKIQQHVDTKECRLLDEDGKSHAAGTFEECRAKFASIKREQNLPPMQGKAVVLLHGLAAPAWSMQLLARHLRKHGGYETFVVEYSSLRSTIDDQARSMAQVMQSLEGIEEINLVGHSMGNIVIRRYLAGDNTPGAGWRPDPRVARIVMIAPPNHGSTAATRLSDNVVFKTVFGESGRQLGVNWADLESRLATPTTEFGIIAGGWGNKLGLNPFQAGDDDGRISVETTRLAGAADFLVVPAVHEFIAHDPRVLNYTLTFLTSGYFISPVAKHGIPREPIAERIGTRTR